MPEFPASPIAPARFMQEFLPAAFEEAAELRASLGELEAIVGVMLVGESGGEWTVHLEAGRVSVRAGSRDAAAFTWIQSVEDWRGALWEGRGGALGEQAAGVFRPGAAGSGALAGVPGPAALAKMRDLEGLVRLEVDGDGDAWRLELKLGPGPIPPEPSATLRIGAADATALARAPEAERASLVLQYFMAGRIRLEGDLGLFLQMQAIQMSVA